MKGEKLAALTRAVVIGSMLLAVLAGLWPLIDRPAVLASLGAVLAAMAGLARWRPAVATIVALAFAYTGYGVVRLLAGPVTAGMPYFLAAFAGLVLGLCSWRTWQARRPWRVPLAWWATGVAVTWPFFAARDLSFSWSPSLAAGPIVATALLQMALALWMDRLLAEGESHRAPLLARRDWQLALIASALVTAGAALYQRWVDISWLSGEPWTRVGRAVGMMGDANPMGVATALWAPLALGAFGSTSAGAVTGAAAASLLWLAAWASGARTTLILMAFGVAGLALVGTGGWNWSRRTLAAVGISLAVAAAIGAFVIAPYVPLASPIGRALQTGGPQSGAASALYELFWRRDGYGLAAVEAIREHPVVGVGIGRFAGLSTRYHQRLTGQAIPPDNAQNFWRQTLAEQGVLGLLPILWLTALTAHSLGRGKVKGTALLQRVMLAGLGASLLVGYPVQDPAIAVTVATLVCAVAHD